MTEEPENTSNSNEQEVVQSIYGDSVDIELPDILLPPEIEEDKTRNEVKDECLVSFKNAFIGSGQGGSRIAETFYGLGYRRVAAINTAQQDLNTISLENKFCFGEGGAGKDPEVARKKFEDKREDVLDFMRRSFGDEVDRIYVCIGAGGGTGSGTLEPLVNTALEMQTAIKSKSKKVGLILALPKYSEGKRVNANAFEGLKKAYDMVASGVVSPLILIDNEKVGKLYPNLSVADFWKVSNHSMAGLFHLFNHTSAKDSTYSAFDSNDYGNLLDSGLIVFGASPVKDWKDSVSISRAVRENLKNNILTGGVDLSSGNTAAGVIIGGTEQLNEIPQKSLDEAFDQLSRMLKPNSIVHRGIYSGDKPNLTVFSAVGGLAEPADKLEELKKIANI